MLRNGIDNIGEEDLREIALERGIEEKELSNLKNRMRTDWLVVCKELEHQTNLQFWFSVINYYK